MYVAMTEAIPQKFFSEAWGEQGSLHQITARNDRIGGGKGLDDLKAAIRLGLSDLDRRPGMLVTRQYPDRALGSLKFKLTVRPANLVKLQEWHRSKNQGIPASMPFL